MVIDIPFTYEIHPILSFLVQILAIGLVVGFTSPSSTIRLAVLPVFLGVSYDIALKTHHGGYVRKPLGAILGAFSLVFLLQFVEMGLLTKWSYESNGPSKRVNPRSSVNGKSNGRKYAPRKAPGTFWGRLKFGFESTTSFRDVGTSHEAKNIPGFSSQDPTFIPSRKRYLIQCILMFSISYLVLDIVENQPPPPNTAELFAAESIPFFRRLSHISAEDIIIRFFGSIAFWIIMYCLLTAMSSACFVFFVGSGIYEVKSCPPLMGPISEAYTIRQLWGKFWHQGTRKSFNGPANFFVDDFLELPKGSLATRYSKIFLTFFISGIVHAMADFSGQVPLLETGALQFFCAQALGIMIEDGVQALYRSISGLKKSDEKPPLWARIVGYIWVAFFVLIWTTPSWCYPTVLRNTGAPEDKLLPLSVYQAFIKT